MVTARSAARHANFVSDGQTVTTLARTGTFIQAVARRINRDDMALAHLSDLCGSGSDLRRVDGSRYADEGWLDGVGQGVAMFVYVTVFWPLVMYLAVRDYLRREE